MTSLPPVPYDSELVAALADAIQQTPTLDQPDYLDRLRVMCAPVTEMHELQIRHPDCQFTELHVPGPAGAPPVTLMIVRPPSHNAGGPALFYIHGGGMIAGNRFTHVEPYLDWARRLNIPLVSVEYRLAPEHPFPASIEDCYAALEWVSEHADTLGIDRSRLIVIGGSAGGGLAAALSLLSRDRQGPAIAAQLLLGPMLDDRNTSASSRQHETTGVWNRQNNLFGWTSLLGHAPGDADVSPYAAPARAASLAGLPPTFIDVGSAEVFRDEASEFAARLWAAGVPAELHVWAGGFHSFELTASDAALSRSARRAQFCFLERIVRDTGIDDY